MHAPVALVDAVIIEHHGHHPPGDEAALVPRPAQKLAAARGLPGAAPGRAHRPRLLLALGDDRTAAGPLLLEHPPTEEVDAAVLRVLPELLCKDMLGGNVGSDVRDMEKLGERRDRRRGGDGDAWIGPQSSSGW